MAATERLRCIQVHGQRRWFLGGLPVRSGQRLQLLTSVGWHDGVAYVPSELGDSVPEFALELTQTGPAGTTTQTVRFALPDNARLRWPERDGEA